MLFALPPVVPTAVAFRDVRHGAIGLGCVTPCRTGRVALTADGGRTLRVVLRTRHGVSWVAFAGRALRASLDDGRLLESRDGGRTWSSWRSRYGAGASFADALHGLTAVRPESGGETLRIGWTSDGGRSWRVVRAPCPRAVAFDAGVALPTPSRGWLLCEGQGSAGNAEKAIYRTGDGGRTWRAAAETIFYPHRRVHGGIESYGYGEGIAFAPDGFGVLWEGRGTLYVTRDGGSRWTAKPQVVQPEIDFGVSAAALPNGRALALVTRGALARRLIATSDFGRTWRLVRRF